MERFKMEDLENVPCLQHRRLSRRTAVGGLHGQPAAALWLHSHSIGECEAPPRGEGGCDCTAGTAGAEVGGARNTNLDRLNPRSSHIRFREDDDARLYSRVASSEVLTVEGKSLGLGLVATASKVSGSRWMQM